MLRAARSSGGRATPAQPGGAKTKTQELVERDKVDFIFGSARRLRGAGDRRLYRAGRTPLLSQAAAEDLTQRKANQCSSGVGDLGQSAHPAGFYMVAEAKSSRWSPTISCARSPCRPGRVRDWAEVTDAG